MEPVAHKPTSIDMANAWGFNVTCGTSTFIFEVMRPAGVIFSDMGVLYLGNKQYKVYFAYISDPSQGSAGTERFDSGVPVPGTCDFNSEFSVDGAVKDEIPVRRTCP